MSNRKYMSLIGMIRQKGGKLLGQGSYGCTFSTVPTCKTGPTPTSNKLVAKVALDTEQELNIGITLMKLPNASSYFALPTSECIPKIPIEDPDVSKCDILNDLEDEDGYQDITYLRTLIMPNAGMTIGSWGYDTIRLANNFIRVMKNLLKGMKLYKDAGYIHNDIHVSNILVDSQNVARYIDFGLAIKTDEFTRMHHMKFKPRYINHPPEIQVWRILYSVYGSSIEEKMKLGLQMFLDVGSREYELLERHYPARLSAVESLTKFAKSTYNEYKRNDFNSIVVKYGDKFDIWRLGLVLWKLWRRVLAWGGPHEILREPLKSSINHILSGMTDFDVTTRWNVEKALEHF
jgi:hypothetical protein